MKHLINWQRFKLYFWIGAAWFLLWEFVILASHPTQFVSRTINEIWRDSLLITLNYLFFEYTLQEISRKRLLRSFFLLAAQLFLYSYGIYAWRQIGIQLNIYTPYRFDPKVGKAIAFQFQYAFFSVFFFGVIRHIYKYRKLIEAAQKLRIEKQEAELNYLKSQTNPHFLFNTLNNIYALAREKSDQAPESILRLSKILRFMLYEAGGDYIAIEDELKIISDYIALERLRYDESVRINFNYDVEDLKQAIPPLLLMPLVENAFKHGVSETRGRAFVDIHLSVKKRQLSFYVRNSSETALEEKMVKENIGLSNLRRQLELLYKDYQLTVQQKEAVFTAVLTINLSSHV